MIPLLTVDEKFVRDNWTKEGADPDWVIDYCAVVYATNDDTPLFQCDNNWVNMGVFNEYKKTHSVCEFYVYGYCDTEEALIKYLQQYKDDEEDDYFVEIGSLSMDYEKYWKCGTYINKDGVDTFDDYYPYIDEHPEMEVEQDIEDTWIKFSIYKLQK